MDGNFIVLVFISSLMIINGQNDDERNVPIARYLSSRTSIQSFESQFSQGRCPRRFYQLGDECVYFANDGKAYSWKQAERLCSKRIARILDDASAGNTDQPNMQPTRGVRQFVLNTPEKTGILQAFARDYSEQNFAVRLPLDYNTLQRCQDGKDDQWPQFCSEKEAANATCVETTTNQLNEICLRQVECQSRYLRLACEFTLPGSMEITTSKFRHCPQTRSGRRRLPLWAWTAIIIGSALLLLTLLGVIFTLIRKSKQNAASKKRTLPEPRPTQPKPKDPTTEPMLIRERPTDITDTGYLQPQSSLPIHTSNA